MNENATSVAREDPGPPKPRIPIAAEILGYVGGALALGAVIALLSAYWVQLGVHGRIGIALAVALAGLLGGWAVSRVDTPAAGRLTQFLLFIGVVGASAAVGFDVLEMANRMNLAAVTKGSMFDTRAEEWTWFAGFATAAVLGGAIWWRRRTTLQQLAYGLGVGIGTLLLLPLLPVNGPDWGAGATLVLVGVVWGTLGLAGRLEPENTALSLASLGVLGGIELMNAAMHPITMSTTWALLLGLVVSVAMLVGSLVVRRMVILGFGAGGVVLFAYQLIDAAFHGTMGAPIAMLFAGLLFVGMAVFVAVRLPRSGRASGEPETVEPATGETPAALEIAAQPGEPVAPSATVEPTAIPLAAEILAYVGGAFAVGAAVALMATFWTQLGFYGRLGVAVLGAAVGLVGGLLIGKQGTRAAHRLEQFLLAIGTVGIGFAAGIVAYDLLGSMLGPVGFDQPDRAAMLAQSIGFWSAALAGFVIWRWRRTGLQLAMFGAAAFAAIGNAFDAGSVGNLAAWWYGGAATLVFAALMWLGAVRKFLTPENVAYAIASIALFAGFLNLQFSPVTETQQPAAVWAGLLVSIGMIVASVPMRRAVILGFGAVGVVIFSVTLVNELFGGQIAGPILMLVIGVVFIGMAALVTILLPRLKGARSGERPTGRMFGPHVGASA